MCSATGAGVNIACNENVPAPWPEDVAWGSSDGKPTTAITSRVHALYNRWTYSYMNRIFRKGAQQKKDASVQLAQEDLYRTPKEMEARKLGNEFWALFKHDGSFRRTLWKLAAPTFVPAGACQLVALLSQLAIPVMVMRLLSAVENSLAGSILNEALPYVLGIFFLSITNAFCMHRYQFLSYQSGIVIRTAVTSAIYEKSLRLSPQGREGLTSGNVTNLIATDTQKLFEVMHDAHMLWSAPLAIFIVVVLLLVIIGPTCLVGALILILLVPLSKKVAVQVVKIRRKRVAVADERIEIINAMLTGIKVTKLNNYEDKFEQRVSEARGREMKLVRLEQSVWGLTLVIRVFTPVLASAATFATYVLVDEGNIMTASVTFTILMLFNMLKFPINQAGQLLSKAALGLQAMQRISAFMDRDENEIDGEHMLVPEDGNNKVLEVKNGTFFVGSIPAHQVNAAVTKTSGVGEEEGCFGGQNPAFTLTGVNFSLARGDVLAVVGEVASGKSTLMQGLLGELQASNATEVTSCSRNVAFAGQTPFILSDTVRNNILFGSEFNEVRYERVLEACCLRPDLQMWPAGDRTEIGERGVTMSGGQKQRVSLARAVYAAPDVALFDDILSALDAGTSQRVFENLFENRSQNGLLRETGVVLVTHAVHVLQRVSKILVLDDGEIIFYGRWVDLQTFVPKNSLHKEKLDAMKSSQQLSPEGGGAHAGKTSQGSESKENSSDLCIAKDVDTENNGATMTKEEREHGISALRTWLLWFKYAGGVVFVVVQIILMTCDRGSYVAIDWWIAQWTTASDQSIVIFGKEFPSQLEGRSAQFQYLAVYAVLVVFMFTFLVCRSQWAVWGGIRACERVFSTMTRRVLHAPMSYFDTTPLGRIINRFTYDVEQVDITLSQFMSIFIIACSWLVAGQAVMIAVVPYMAVINSFVLFLYVLILRHYRWSAADLQRLDAVSRSPIQASMAEALDGSTTIRAFHKNNYFLGIFQGYIDNNAGAMLNFVASRRWLAVRLESLGAFVTLAACLFIATFQEQLGLSPGLSGLLIIWASSMTVTLGFLINAFSETEAAITSIERMFAMEMIPQEKSMVTSPEHGVDSSWPRKGVLEFSGVKMRYRPKLPLALNGLTFTLEHGQRCAVVGRTGAGKSSITSALFRLVEIESGYISLDGVDLSQLGLADIRGRPGGMFILPQDPVLFSGSIKTNLDPFSTHVDEDILKSLELVRFPGASKYSILEDIVEEGGGNFSAGEKQLLCLARAMLARPRLLVLDEATSSVDLATDEFVQKMLRSQFPDTTLLTIAHRLNTIIDYDVVLVMDKGRVAEFGSPKTLLESENGMFTAMVNATGQESAASLKAMAK